MFASGVSERNPPTLNRALNINLLHRLFQSLLVKQEGSLHQDKRLALKRNREKKRSQARETQTYLLMPQSSPGGSTTESKSTWLQSMFKLIRGGSNTSGVINLCGASGATATSAMPLVLPLLPKTLTHKTNVLQTCHQTHPHPQQTLKNTKKNLAIHHKSPKNLQEKKTNNHRNSFKYMPVLREEALKSLPRGQECKKPPQSSKAVLRKSVNKTEEKRERARG